MSSAHAKKNQSKELVPRAQGRWLLLACVLLAWAVGRAGKTRDREVKQCGVIFVSVSNLFLIYFLHCVSVFPCLVCPTTTYSIHYCARVCLALSCLLRPPPQLNKQSIIVCLPCLACPTATKPKIQLIISLV